MLTLRGSLGTTVGGFPLAAVALARWRGTALGLSVTDLRPRHGSWHGGRCWKRIADRPRGNGHVVCIPSETGMGDRARRLTQDITISTIVDDLADVVAADHTHRRKPCGCPATLTTERQPLRILTLAEHEDCYWRGCSSSSNVCSGSVVCGGSGRAPLERLCALKRSSRSAAIRTPGPAHGRIVTFIVESLTTNNVKNDIQFGCPLSTNRPGSAAHAWRPLGRT
jgi:hypothetical protein